MLNVYPKKNRQHETNTEREARKEMTQEQNSKLITQPYLARYNGNEENIVTTDTGKT